MELRKIACCYWNEILDFECGISKSERLPALLKNDWRVSGTRENASLLYVAFSKLPLHAGSAHKVVDRSSVVQNIWMLSPVILIVKLAFSEYLLTFYPRSSSSWLKVISRLSKQHWWDAITFPIQRSRDGRICYLLLKNITCPGRVTSR